MTADWRHRAACRVVDPELMFPAPSATVTIADARDVCDTCPVLAACRTYALGNPAEAAFGVWGGMTEGERAALLRLRVPRDPDHPRQPRKTGRPRAECGTAAAYDRHIKHHERACDPCRAAKRRRDEEYRGRTKAVS